MVIQVGFNYEKNRNWKREQDWIEDEKLAFQSYSEYALQAQKHAQGEISFMNSPELEMAINWRDSKTIDENWAKKYSLNYLKTINYINESEKHFNLNKHKEEHTRTHQHTPYTHLSPIPLHSHAQSLTPRCAYPTARCAVGEPGCREQGADGRAGHAVC